MFSRSIPQAACCDEEYVLPSAEALLAGTLALMTGYAQSEPGHQHRSLMARKLASNLFFLAEHPDISAPMRSMIERLRARWQLVAEADPPVVPTPLWHRAPEAVQ